MSKLILGFMIAMISGCQSIGTIQGTSEGSSIQLDYQQGFLENDGVLKVTMPSGEQFAGKFVQNSSTKSGIDWGIGESSGDDNFILTSSNKRTCQAEAI